MADWEKYLAGIYFNPKHKAAFAGPKKLYKMVKEEGQHKITFSDIKSWMQKQDVYTLHRPVRYNFKRLRVITAGIDDLWDADLADVSNLAMHNDDVHFLLIVIDVFSRYLWVVQLKQKTSKALVAAFTQVFAGGRKPTSIRTDKGKEFTNRWVKALMKENGVNLFTTKNEVKANYAERVIRTLKGMMFRYFTHKQTYRYVEVLDSLVSNYNHRPHTSLGALSPSQVEKSNEAMIWKEMYVDKRKFSKPKPFKLKVGGRVRISHVRYTFQRDYQAKWTEEIFTIASRLRRQGIPQYKLMDYADERVDGSFYEYELQPVTKTSDDMWKVEKIIRRRRRKGKAEILVKWMGWPVKFNSWIAADTIQDL